MCLRRQPSRQTSHQDCNVTLRRTCYALPQLAGQAHFSATMNVTHASRASAGGNQASPNSASRHQSRHRGVAQCGAPKLLSATRRATVVYQYVSMSVRIGCALGEAPREEDAEQQGDVEAGINDRKLPLLLPGLEVRAPLRPPCHQQPPHLRASRSLPSDGQFLVLWHRKGLQSQSVVSVASI